MTMGKSRVVVYSKSNCEYSRAALALLKKQGIPFDNIDVTNDPDARAELVQRANGCRTTPVIFVDDEPIGGYQELASLVRLGKLEHLVGAA